VNGNILWPTAPAVLVVVGAWRPLMGENHFAPPRRRTGSSWVDGRCCRYPGARDPRAPGVTRGWRPPWRDFKGKISVVFYLCAAARVHQPVDAGITCWWRSVADPGPPHRAGSLRLTGRGVGPSGRRAPRRVARKTQKSPQTAPQLQGPGRARTAARDGPEPCFSVPTPTSVFRAFSPFPRNTCFVVFVMASASPCGSGRFRLARPQQRRGGAPHGPRRRLGRRARPAGGHDRRRAPGALHDGRPAAFAWHRRAGTTGTADDGRRARPGRWTTGADDGRRRTTRAGRASTGTAARASDSPPAPAL
jgi:hypothetical protein